MELTDRGSNSLGSTTTVLQPSAVCAKKLSEQGKHLMQYFKIKINTKIHDVQNNHIFK